MVTIPLVVMGGMLYFLYRVISRGQQAGAATQVEVSDSAEGQVIDIPIRDASWLTARSDSFRIEQTMAFCYLKLYPQGIEYRVARPDRVAYHEITKVDVPNPRRPNYVIFRFAHGRRGVSFRLGNEQLTRQLMWYLARTDAQLTERARSYAAQN